MRRKGRLWLAVGVIVAALAVLVVNGSKNLTEYYMTIPQFSAQSATLVGQQVRISGTLVGNSVHYDPRANLLTFKIQGGSQEVEVAYHGVQPEDFQQSVNAIVNGTLLPDHVFEANQVLVQCPSHYGPASGGAKNS